MHRVSVNLYLTYTKASSVVTSHTDKRGEFHSKQLTVTDLELQVEDLKSKHSPIESLWDATIYQHEGITLSYMIKLIATWDKRYILSLMPCVTNFKQIKSTKL